MLKSIVETAENSVNCFYWLAKKKLRGNSIGEFGIFQEGAYSTPEIQAIVLDAVVDHICYKELSPAKEKRRQG